MRVSPLLITCFALVGCDLVRSNDPLALNEDVVAIETVLFAGYNEVFAAVGFPHRTSGMERAVELTLSGDGQVAVFKPMTSAGECPQNPFLMGPLPLFDCMVARLNNPIRSGITYRLVGGGSNSGIVGETTVPSTPQILSPTRDTVLKRITEGRGIATLKLRLGKNTGVEYVVLRISDVALKLSSEEIVTRCGLHTFPATGAPLAFDEDQEVSLRSLDCPFVEPAWTEMSFKLQVIGYNQAYASFANAGIGTLREPLPDFGLQGAVGVFAAAASSRQLNILVR